MIERQNMIYKMRYEEKKTLQEIADNFKITRERIRQILQASNKKNDIQQERKILKINALKNIINENWTSMAKLTVQEISTNLKISKPYLRNHILSQIQVAQIDCNKAVAKRYKLTKEECVRALQRAQAYHFPLTAKQYASLLKNNELTGPSLASLLQRFGTWINACATAGVNTGESHNQYSKKWSDSDLLIFVFKFMQQTTPKNWTKGNYDQWRKNPLIQGPSFTLCTVQLGNWRTIKKQVFIRFPEIISRAT